MSFTLVSSTAGRWYVLFTNSNDGEKYFLPIKKKVIGKWDVNNCPKFNVRYRFGVYEISDLGVKTQKEMLDEFKQQYATPEEYLEKLKD